MTSGAQTNMCKACSNTDADLPSPNGRRKLAEIDGCYHCTILGTCLTLGELKKVAARADIQLSADATEYAIHVTFVNLVSQRPHVAKLMHKALDRKYSTAISRAKAISCRDVLLDYWKEKMASGAVASTFWAVMTHPLADEGLRQHVFGDVHMLSHMVGAANRADLKRLDTLEHASRDLEVALEEERLRHRQLVEERNAIIVELKTKLEEQSLLRGRIIGLEARISQFEGDGELSALRQKIYAQEAELCENADVMLRTGKRMAELDEQNEDTKVENIRLRELVSHTLAEAGRVERLLEQSLMKSGDRGAGGQARTNRVTFNLNGATVIYVGGRTSQVTHFRALVEQANGAFLHHDGGLEDGDSKLNQILSRGDIVMCPIDCVSHSACKRAKKFCKHAGKCFVPLRSSGLSSFVSGLEDLTKNV